MREILFRGKRIDNGEWCIGFYCQMADESDGGARVKHAIVVPTFMVQMGFLVYEVDHETVGQYTGLTDKNGKKIFEGDILLIRSAHHLVGDKNEDIGQVALHGVGDCWWAKSKHELSHYPYGYYLSVMCDKETYNTDYEVEIIGNVYDNPELMKGEQK